MLRLALASIALVGLVAEPAFARMMTSSSFASRGVSVGPRTSIGTLKSFNTSPGGGLTAGRTQGSSTQGTAFKRYKLENAWPTKAGAASSGRLVGSKTDAGLLLPAVQAAREPARTK
jgi:hypothetical protein